MFFGIFAGKLMFFVYLNVPLNINFSMANRFFIRRLVDLFIRCLHLARRSVDVFSVFLKVNKIFFAYCRTAIQSLFIERPTQYQFFHGKLIVYTSILKYDPH